MIQTVTNEISSHIAARQAQGGAEPFMSLETKLTQRVEEKLQEIQKGVAEGFSRLAAERILPLVDDRIKKALSGSAAADSSRTKETIAEVIQASLLDSGLLEKFVARVVEQKLKNLPASGGGSPESPEKIVAACRKEIQEVVQKEVATALSSEHIKVMIDDKFRAIHLYLKTEVIPKAVSQAMKGGKTQG